MLSGENTVLTEKCSREYIFKFGRNWVELGKEGSYEEGKEQATGLGKRLENSLTSRR